MESSLSPAPCFCKRGPVQLCELSESDLGFSISSLIGKREVTKER